MKHSSIIYKNGKASAVVLPIRFYLKILRRISWYIWKLHVARAQKKAQAGRGRAETTKRRRYPAAEMDFSVFRADF